MTEEEQLAAGIASLEAQRDKLGGAIIDPVLAPLRARLQALREHAREQSQSQVLRQVTVMFIGFAGSAAMADVADPETVAALLDPTLQACMQAVQAHGGAVLQVGSDNLLAGFGARQAREDDAERAVHCALALLPLGDALSARMQRELGLAAGAVQVGLHTGQVLLGGGVDNEGTIRGGPVNLAARMQQTAPPGAVRLSRDTERLVQGLFELAPQPPLQVKGHAQPLQTWLVLRPLQAAGAGLRAPGRGIAGLDTPLLGRERELARLRALLLQLRAAGADAAPLGCTVLADAGLGKSRLLHEACQAMQARQPEGPPPVLLLGARAQAAAMLQPYGLLREVLAAHLGIADSSSAEVARQQLLLGVAPLLAGPDDAGRGTLRAQALGQLVGMDFSASPELAPMLNAPRALRDQGLAALADWLRALATAAAAPVVLVLDDLQWADEASLDALQTLAGVPGLPLLLLLAARPALLERRPQWAQGWPGHERLTLTELDAPARAALTRALLQRLQDTPDELRALIDSQAAGNPFYAEELVKMLIDDGVIEADGPVWRLHRERLQAAQVPATLTGVLQARLDVLPAAERRALQAASVVGPVFWDQAVATLAPDAPQSLGALQARALVRERPGSAFEGTLEQAFQHHLLHQVTYDTVLRAERRAGHARAAAWLAARAGGRSAEIMAIAAEHWERAGDEVQALQWYERAMREATTRFAHSTVLAYAERALALVPADDPRRRYQLLLRKVFSADVLGLRDLQAQGLQQKLQAAEAAGDDALRAGALSGMALLADRLGERERARELAEQGRVVAEAAGAAGDAALCWGELSWLSRQRGEMAQSWRELEAGLVWARRAREAEPSVPLYEMQLLAVKAGLHGSEHDPLNQRRMALEALALAEQHREARMQLACHDIVATAAHALGDAAEAAHHLMHSETLAQAMGAVVYIAATHRGRALLALEAGDPERALAEAQAAERAYARSGARDYCAAMLEIQAQAVLAGARLAGTSGAGAADAQTAPREGAAARPGARPGTPADGPPQALALLRQAETLYRDSAAVAEARCCRLLQAGVLAQTQDLAAALQLVEAEMEHLQQPGGLDPCEQVLPARLAVWQVLQRAADPRADQHLALAGADLWRRLACAPDEPTRQRMIAGQSAYRAVAQACAAAGCPVGPPPSP